MENKGGKNEILPDVPERAEQGSLGAVEKILPSPEMPPIEAEQTPEQAAIASMPPEIPVANLDDNVVKNNLPDIERNAEHIPKPYMKLLEEKTEAVDNDPNAKVEVVKEFKRDYLYKAFGRTVGKAA